MAAVSDKAEFYIEQTVPELQEWLRKEIFSKAEITQITSRRTRFEHLVNSREATPSIYARYASYEMNLESLRRKRVKRLGVKMPVHTGQRRIYYVLDRATKKFHGDLGLWMLYIEYARKCRANKKTEELLTRVLRMQPTKPEMWIYAANWALDEEGNMGAARGYVQRGLRFCEKAKDLWVEYAKLEMIYIMKIVGRRRILGLDESRPASAPILDADGGVALDADTIALPSVTGADLAPPSIDQEESADRLHDQLATSPVLSGAIPLSIFDAAMKKFYRDEALAIRFFNMFADFTSAPCLRQLLQHVLDVLRSPKHPSAAAVFCLLRMPLIGIEPSSPDFPPALGQCLTQINETMSEMPEEAPSLTPYVLKLLVPFYAADSLDESLQRVIGASIRRYMKWIDGPRLGNIVEDLRESKQDGAADSLLKLGLKQFGPLTELQNLQLPSKTRSAVLDSR